ncbi:MAG: hypothetical protein N2691_04480 [Patescibacteria group bacterium]|nr:hypothetical protein [Patescibacteria group bacterium]
MKITCIMVQSVNGRIAHNDEPGAQSWISPEAQRHLATMIETSPLIVMGRKTYNDAAGTMKHRSGKLRIVLTSSPEKYARYTIPGKLEFRKDTPRGIVQEFNGNYGTLLLVTGMKSSVRLELVSSTRLNTRGTLLLHYRVLRFAQLCKTAPGEE